MKILVINAGSSSLKYQLIDMHNEEVIAKGVCERIGIDSGIVKYETSDGKQQKLSIEMPDHKAAFQQVKNLLLDEKIGAMKSLDEVDAVGHRVVQGGAFFQESILIDEKVLSAIEGLIPLAPLHNPANLQGILACREIFSEDTIQVAVFDTAFHSTMPRKAYMYPIPYKYYEKYGIRRYGFHGTSHKYVSHRCAELLGKDIRSLKIITCHLGNGSSMAAVKRGKVIDTSMGFTPLDGFMMGTRAGTLDPSVVTFLAEKEKLSFEQINDILNKKSGLIGVSGISSDDRDLEKAVFEGKDRAILAYEMLQYQITKFIGGYVAALNGCDAIAFTAGLGENNSEHRFKICESLTYLGVKIDYKVNKDTVRSKEGIISTKDSKIDVLVIPTNEELVIARDTKNLVQSKLMN